MKKLQLTTEQKRILLIVCSAVAAVAVIVTVMFAARSCGGGGAAEITVAPSRECDDAAAYITSDGDASGGGMTETETAHITDAPDTETAPDTTEDSEPVKDMDTTEAPGTINPPVTTEDPPETASPSENIVSPSVSGKLHVSGTRLCGEDGKPVILRGVSTHGLSWFPQYVNAQCFSTLRSWGANVIRLAMYTAESGGYCTGGDRSALAELIKNGVKYATACDMYVIIDWHILSDGDPNTYKSDALAFFSEMSALYKDYDNVIYEICNEPNGGVDWGRIKSYAVDVIAAIRRNDPDAIILVGTSNWSQYVDEAARDPISGYNNIMYTLHFYAATHRDDLRQKMESAVRSGLPIFVSEFGICDASGSGGIDYDEAGRWVDSMESLGISCVMWNLSNKNETSSILSPGCTKTGGFVYGDLSPSGRWLYELLTGSERPTDTTPPETTPPSDTTPPETDAPPKTAISWHQGGILVTASLVNSWEEGGVPVYQYALTLENVSELDISSWKISVRFDGAPTLVNSWNGSFVVSGDTVTVSSLDYNGALGKISDVGMIVKGAAVTGG